MLPVNALLLNVQLSAYVHKRRGVGQEVVIQKRCALCPNVVIFRQVVACPADIIITLGEEGWVHEMCAHIV